MKPVPSWVEDHGVWIFYVEDEPLAEVYLDPETGWFYWLVFPFGSPKFETQVPDVETAKRSAERDLIVNLWEM